jgi:Protein of unknown function (DUF1566)
MKFSHKYATNIIRTITISLILSLVSCQPKAEDDNPSIDDTATDDQQAEQITYDFAVVDTGQSTCYDDSSSVTCPGEGEAFSGQDAQYDGYQPAYRDNGDGTVTDLVTGLMWQQSPDLDGDGDIDVADKLSYDEALAGAESFDLAGYDDWRLPNIKEAYSLIQFNGVDPSGYEGTDISGLIPFIDTDYFDYGYGDTNAGERIIDSQFATTSLYVSETMGGDATMFGVNFADGRIKGYGIDPLPGQTEDKQFYVLYVREGDDYTENDFVDNGDGTIADQATGLTWGQEDSAEGMVWEDALAYCEGLELADFDDWQLPNVKELQSIVDYSRSPDTTSSAAIDPLFGVTSITNEAGEADYPFFWSSTTHANFMEQGNGGNAAYVAFGRALGYMNGSWMDVHGAGAQRSDPKSGNPADYPEGHGPQGDAIRIYNHVRCVRADDITSSDTLGSDESSVADNNAATLEGGNPSGPVSCSDESDCLSDEACPPDALLGCTCGENPEGDSFCMPTCVTDSDCPVPPDLTLVCSEENTCVPENGSLPPQ